LFQTVNKNFEGNFSPSVIPKLENFIRGSDKVSYNILVVVRRALAVYTVSVKLSHIYQNSTKVDEIQGTYGGMTSACDREIGQHFQA